MSIPSRLAHYLAEHGARYGVYAHRHSRCSAETARLANVRPHLLAKSVLLEDDSGPVMAIVPADTKVRLTLVSQLLGRHRLHLSDEARIDALFADCERGAMPPVGMPWGVPTVVDSEFEANEVVYLECGDHESLLRLSNAQFRELMRGARHGHFSREPAH
ncbi:MAG TPA: YbaK/EbsC family protein [Burkholderiaceae bacterium]